MKQKTTSLNYLLLIRQWFDKEYWIKENKMNNYNELVSKLKEIFQIDKPELDFGIYRILNARADEINDYLENKLKAKVQTALSEAGNANKEELEKQLAEAIKGAEALGVDPSSIPKVKDLKNQIAQSALGANEHESAVFTHLLTFFSRYYDDGDFISKRRYKGDTYAIPYAGEEVMLHWANKDQYYIKSGENFSNYSFKLDDGRKVSFKLLAADTAKDNRKDNDADRRFVLIEPHNRTKLDENGEESEVEYRPVDFYKTADVEELVIQFEYKAMKKGTKQDTLVQAAISTVLESELVQSGWADVAKRAPTEKNPNRTELERHLTTYTQRNTADYFIHKNLGEFLNNELDFYIKNEVMNLDNIQNADVFANVEKQLRMIQCLRCIAMELVEFLSQLENFQKKLWMKKKFVTSSDYCLTLDLLSPELKKEALNSEVQIERWKDLGFISDKNDVHELEYLPVDTELFGARFKEKILSLFDDIDSKVDHLMINGDNYHALRLIKTKYRNSVDSIYIDPPYNTNASEILYKNGFKHSAWNSLIENRVKEGYELLAETGMQAFTIDDYELESSLLINNEIFGSEHHLATVPIRNNPQGRSTVSGFSVNHEYAIFHRKTDQVNSVGRLPRNEAQNQRYNESDENGNKFLWENFRKTGTDSSRKDRPKQFYPILISNDSVSFPDMIWNNEDNKWDYDIPSDYLGSLVLPIDSTGAERVWKWGIERARKELAHLKCETIRGREEIYRRNYLNDEGKLPGTWWDDAAYAAGSHGTNLLSSMFTRDRLFLFPKSYKAVIDSLKVAGAYKHSLILDYFAGSASTGHAVVAMNDEDNGSRRSILVEQGEYFDLITKPRMQKCIFSSLWKDGKPIKIRNKPSIIKVLKIESYEDTLNNIALSKPTETLELFDQVASEVTNDYLIKYMLETESKSSLLSTDSFRKPFDYEMDISADSAGATERKSIDLIDTFNYLIGLLVKSVESNIERGYVRVEGFLPNGERALILWRDCDKIGYEELTKYASRFDLYAKEQTFDVIYINGDHNLPTAFTSDDEDGEITRTLKLRQIEPEFLSKMFAEETL